VDIPDIGRGYPLGRGRHVVLDDRDLARLPPPSVRALDIAAFVPISDIDPLYFQRAYYLAPERAGLRPYVLLRNTLHATNRAGVGKVVLREREALAVLRARADVLVLHTVLWPDEIREPRFPFRGQAVAVSPDELEAAGALIEAMSGRIVSLEEFTDEYREALHSLIDAKAAGLALPEPPAAPPQVEAAELMAVLERSVEQARARREAHEDCGGLRPPWHGGHRHHGQVSNACSNNGRLGLSVLRGKVSADSGWPP
jgi:DNA end-binding protein Ku